jgi:uncharacterized surface protein with fasciclin (FAS1) repeats
MQNSKLSPLRNATTKLFALFVAMIMVVSSCNQSDEDVAPATDEDLLTSYLEAFDEEVTYSEYTSEESNARWSSKYVKRTPTFFTLSSALIYTGLVKTVAKEKLTIFAPDDNAFAKIGLNFWNIKKVDKTTLTNILLSHVVAGNVYSNGLPDCSAETVNKSSIGIIRANGGIVLKDDSADAINLIFVDKRVGNDVIHAIDKVLTLAIPTQTIKEIAVGAASSAQPEFTQLVAALIRADLVGAVADPNANLTVFAPTDKAFMTLYQALGVSGVDKISKDVLTKVLLHHVAGDRAFSFCLSDGEEIPTLNGDKLTVDLGALSIISSSGNAAKLSVSGLDIKASNGVIHVIESVLVPSNYLD